MEAGIKYRRPVRIPLSKYRWNLALISSYGTWSSGSWINAFAIVALIVSARAWKTTSSNVLNNIYFNEKFNIINSVKSVKSVEVFWNILFKTSSSLDDRRPVCRKFLKVEPYYTKHSSHFLQLRLTNIYKNNSCWKVKPPPKMIDGISLDQDVYFRIHSLETNHNFQFFYMIFSIFHDFSWFLFINFGKIYHFHYWCIKRDFHFCTWL